jgi:DNA-binding LacI/PurR family transcriptional regulator
MTLQDIADVLSVTAATVSKALRDSSDISPATKATVRKVSLQLGYRPNLLARSLINNKSKILGVLVPDLRISFYTAAVRGIYEEASKKGYQCVILVHDELESREKEKLEFLSDISVDGVLLNAAGGKANNATIESLAKQGIRIVCWDRSFEDFGFRSAKIDDVKAAYNLTSKIISHERKRILFLGPHTRIPLLKERFEGYRMALKEHGISYEPELVVQSFRSIDDSHEKILALMKQGIQFDGMISISGGMSTYGAGKAILEMKRRIPEDVIIGDFGDNEIVFRLGVPFYSVDQKPHEIGIAATDLIIKLIESGRPDVDFADVLIGAEVVERRPVRLCN